MTSQCTENRFQMPHPAFPLAFILSLTPFQPDCVYFAPLELSNLDLPWGLCTCCFLPFGSLLKRLLHGGLSPHPSLSIQQPCSVFLFMSRLSEIVLSFSHLFPFFGVHFICIYCFFSPPLPLAPKYKLLSWILLYPCCNKKYFAQTTPLNNWEMTE